MLRSANKPMAREILPPVYNTGSKKEPPSRRLGGPQVTSKPVPLPETPASEAPWLKPAELAYLQPALTILKQKEQEVAKIFGTNIESIHNRSACKYMTDEDVVKKLKQSGFGAHIYHTVPQVVFEHVHLRIDNPLDPTDPFVIDDVWQQCQPESKHKATDPGMMVVKLSQMERFLDEHGITEPEDVDSEDLPYAGFISRPSVAYIGHLPWTASLDEELLRQDND